MDNDRFCVRARLINLLRLPGRRVEGNTSDGSAIYSNTRSEGFGDEVRRRIILGTYVLTEGYVSSHF